MVGGANRERTTGCWNGGIGAQQLPAAVLMSQTTGCHARPIWAARCDVSVRMQKLPLAMKGQTLRCWEESRPSDCIDPLLISAACTYLPEV